MLFLVSCGVCDFVLGVRNVDLCWLQPFEGIGVCL